MRVVDYLVESIAMLNIRHIFGVDGANIEDLYDAIFDNGRIQGVVAKHEFSAATMADGYARSTSWLGVVCATSGGGAMNTIAGLTESAASRVPVLAIIGLPPTALEGNGAFQDTSGRAGSFDAVALFGSFARYCARVDNPGDIVEHLDRAVAAALTGGPAVLLLPKDIQQAEIGTPAKFRRPQPLPAQQPDVLDALRAKLEAARQRGKVVVIAGDQVARDDARDQLRRLAIGLDAAVGVAPDAKDVYGADEHGFCGVAGTMGNAELADAVRQASLCVLVGTRLPVTARIDVTGAEMVSIGAGSPFVATDHVESVNLRADLGALASGYPDVARRPANHTLTTLAVPAAAGPGLRYREAVDALAAGMPPDADVFADAGNTGAAVVHHLPITAGRRFVVALGMGGMGYTFGAGIGSALARRRRTFVIAGDGSFYMHGMEIHTAIEQHAPVTFVVFNNNAHAMCVTREQLFYRDRYSYNRFRPAQLGDGIAAMFPHLPARTARTVGELTDALAAVADTDGPSFIGVDCDPDEIPPFTPFLSHPALEERSNR